MTTIVFDGKTLAVDTAMYSGNTYSGEVSKVREIELNGKKCLIAMCGEFADFEPFISKITGGETNHDTSGSSFIVININNPSFFICFDLSYHTIEKVLLVLLVVSYSISKLNHHF